jgi:tetraacyldisaccharide 4'-kinase
LEEYFLSLIRGRRRGPWAGLQRAGLWLVSVPYGWGVRLRNRRYDRGRRSIHRASVPVVSVGNLTLGGTGKTPCVEYVARFYRQLGRRVALLSRGYRSEQGRNDEALLLKENLADVPHYQGADRAALAMRAVAETESDVLVLDDGFQHRRLARNLDLVLLDASDPWGQGHLFPRGLLREPPSSLRRAGIVLLTRCDQASAEAMQQLREQVARFAPGVPIVEAVHEPVEWVNADRQARPLEDLQGRPVLAFCGIGNPVAFRQTLQGLGAEVAAFRAFSDHHKYTRSDLEELNTWAGQHAKDCVVVTTQKDLVKICLARLGSRELWALRVQLHIRAGHEVLDRKLKEALG